MHAIASILSLERFSPVFDGVLVNLLPRAPASLFIYSLEKRTTEFLLNASLACNLEGRRETIIEAFSFF